MDYKEQISQVANGLLVRAPAKINLSLLIAGKRPDGFHDIETVMAKVGYYDEILIQSGQKPGIQLVCTGPYWAPEGKDNLIYKAAEMLLESCGRIADIKITLTKNIPAGSGLGSASSDAAATLIGLNEFLKLPLDKTNLARLAAILGSDVPFFLDGPLALCTGRGEKIRRLNENFEFRALILLPDVSVSTKKVYVNYEHNSAIYHKLSAQINDYIKKSRIDLLAKMCTNILELSCFSLHKELGDLKAKTEALGIRPLCLSGTGSAMFCFLDSADEKKTKHNTRKLQTLIGCKCIIVRNNRW